MSCTRDEFNRVRDAVLEVLDDSVMSSYFDTDKRIVGGLLSDVERSLFADALHEEAERKLLADLLAKYGHPDAAP